jgi:hypothetical protein
LVVVGVELGDGDLAVVVFGELFHDGGDALAGAAPGGPGVDDDVGVLLDELGEVGVRDVDGLRGRGHRGLLTGCSVISIR